MIKFCVSSIIAFLIFAHFPATAQSTGVATEKSAIKQGFAFPEDKAVKLILFRPDVRVGEQTAGGLDQPSAAWTAQARGFLTVSLTGAEAAQNNEIAVMPELSGEDAAVMADYRSLFKLVASAALNHKLFAENRLPTKNDRFDWTLGKNASRLGEIGGGEYGLFIYTYDNYGSAGRKAVQAVSAALGVDASPGVHIGYAGLVDLQTGDLVWMNADVAMGGDIRTAAGADRRVTQLLRNFPKRGNQAVVTAGS